MVIPGSKQTLRDLTSLRRTGLDAQLIDFAMQGGEVFGICGGMQMMGESLQDPDGLEGEPHTDTPSGHVPGLALLPIQTVFGGDKAPDNGTAPRFGQRRCPAAAGGIRTSPGTDGGLW